MIGRLDLIHHRLIGMTAGKQSGDRRQHGQYRRAQGHPRNPWGPTMLCVMMNFFLQIFERNFGFFHHSILGSAKRRSSRNWLR